MWAFSGQNSIFIILYTVQFTILWSNGQHVVSRNFKDMEIDKYRNDPWENGTYLKKIPDAAIELNDPNEKERTPVWRLKENRQYRHYPQELTSNDLNVTSMQFEYPNSSLGDTRRRWHKVFPYNIGWPRFPKIMWYHYYTEDYVRGICYVCGIWDADRIPKSPTCHAMFNSNDGTYKAKRFRFRAYCHKNTYDWRIEWAIKSNPYFGKTYYGTYGQLKYMFGYYIGGCYKRFLDVGMVYTQRGCRSWPPMTSPSYASQRYVRMEFLLFRKKNGCVFSPHASLTPFQRGISLYVRYHVCVCIGRYCNNAPPNFNMHAQMYIVTTSLIAMLLVNLLLLQL